jgi:hypothetical protein
MKYYKFLDLDHDRVIKFFRLYCKENLNQIENFWNIVDTALLLKMCPDIQMMFDHLNIRVKKIVIVSTNNTSMEDCIHRDHTEDSSRINIPIYNCENSVTNFYSSNKSQSMNYLDNGVSYYKINRADCELVDTMTLTRPAVLHVQSLHQVVVNSPNTTRLAATVSFFEDIDYLLE